MTDFTITITDQSHLDGIANARAKYNESNPQNQLKDDQAYFELIAASWFAQYAQQKIDADVAKIVDVIRADPAVLAKAMATVQADIDAKAQAADVIAAAITAKG